jgi:hydrogenase nickel incorporation protein HypA/HybF
VHELGIAEDILGLIAKQVTPPRAVGAVHLTLGPLSGVSGEALRFCFTEVAETRGYGRPTLHIDEPFAHVCCQDCKREYETREFLDGCPDCGSFRREIRTGMELTLDWIELEDT